MSDDLKQSALDYHRYPKPGKLEIKAIKPLANQRDLALAYSPGVAYACKEIEADPLSAADYTSRGNLVAVITNGTAVLGLGAIGSLASKPVMEGKAVLFKEFAGIDVFDIEVDELDPEQFIETVARLEPSFGGINLEDIKAPECFIIEQGLKERMNIPVFHDDQHGTAIVVAAAVYNGLRVVGKAIDEVRLVASGAGAASLACLDLLVAMGMKREHITVCDQTGVIYSGRGERMDPYKARYARETEARTLADALPGADIFLGLSVAGVLKPEYLRGMAEKPLVLALANPTPEIMPDLALAERPDAIIATGRSDFPNQVNNVLCFPFLFRGALDVGATEINEQMKMAAVRAIADLAMAETSDVVRSAYGGQELQFGPGYLIPKPFDPRLIGYVAPAVARAAMESGVAQRPLDDLRAYRERLNNTVFKTGMTMKPVFDSARVKARRVVFAEGESAKVLETLPQIVEQGIARPIVVGRREVIRQRIADLGISVEMDEDFDLVDPQDFDEYPRYVEAYYARVARKGYSRIEARRYVRTNTTVLAALMVRLGRADAMICGARGRYHDHLRHIEEVIGRAPGVGRLTALSALVLKRGTLFMADTYIQNDPSAEELAEIVRLCAREVRWFGEEPRVGLLSHSDFGTHNTASAEKMRRAYELISQTQPELQVEGEMGASFALSIEALKKRFPATRMQAPANLLVMPNLDAANISFNIVRQLADGIAIGPILVGTEKSAHIVTSNVTVRGLLNMTAIAAVRSS
ncbi:MAG: NADP-dependent malic enzyme [Candidatus Sedimenticola endophacoides]|uniref:NADP-dependent malic enzyme n=1 Tax=Candidatus Sedimenticola endophacoides TaxID=2548426 RepID=A0A6N4DRB7_9GAMM|nr:MAG: NADP-dependent malic enzyme [Candidatus Sedimenticola endophacoides]OQX33943.1 MAG: NADP-dependent malic enzyme [Candidatus Sedimenticola endophacoides]OQX41030.1 MAG: NADP-dependent malic enzyme [Candidatus Sedimenticola endophacoides]PUD98847.1 MAG: NADP-dependent malic enzyme [Candidatus Sedimenticola endophacoides]PUD99465.1 MAG: NADP-dependent malic enzyme [Candidatus Sedimenticola endophacoides]